ncbi:MAG: TRAP transporter small permease [Brevinema sp.]
MQILLQKIENKTASALLILALLCFLSLIGVVVLQVITRLFLPITISWTEEVSRYLFLYCIAFAAPVALKNRELVFVDLFVMNLSTNLQTILLFLSDTMIFILTLCIMVKSVSYTQLGIGQLSPALQMPMWIPYFSMFILSFFLAFFSGITLLRHMDMIIKR